MTTRQNQIVVVLAKKLLDIKIEFRAIRCAAGMNETQLQSSCATTKVDELIFNVFFFHVQYEIVDVETMVKEVADHQVGVFIFMFSMRLWMQRQW